MSAKGHKRTSFEASRQEVFYRNGIELPLTLDCWRYFKRGGPPPYARLQVRKMGSKMKNQIVDAFKKNQIVVALIVGGAIIIAPAIFIVALIRLANVRGTGAALARPVSQKLDAWRRGEDVIARRRVDAVE